MSSLSSLVYSTISIPFAAKSTSRSAILECLPIFTLGQEITKECLAFERSDKFTSKIQTLAFDETVDVDALMQEAEGSLFELGQRNIQLLLVAY